MNTVRPTVLAAAMVAFAASAPAEFIRPSTLSIDINPGQTLPVRYLLEQSSTPLFGYSLSLSITSAALAAGQVQPVAVNTQLTNFFDSANLITAAGLQRDPLFSQIQATPDGVFISTNTADGSTVASIPGINDVLAEIFFSAAHDAPASSYDVILGPASALSDGEGFPVAFTAQTLRVNVVPAPGGALLVILAFARSRSRPIRTV